MKKSDLDNFYFFKSIDGENDIVAMELNCFEASVYNIIKNMNLINKDSIVPLFIRDITPTLWYNSTTGIFRLNNQSKDIIPLWHKYVNIHKYVMKHDKGSLRFLEALLDKGQMVIVQTVFEILNYYVKYDPEYDLNQYYEGEANHANIVLFHEEDKIYFAEKMPFNINEKNFVPYEFNSQIGVAQKSDIQKACNYFLRCYTLEVDEHGLKNDKAIQEDVCKLIHDISGNHFACSEELDGYTRYYGIEAMKKLIEFCDQGLSLNNYFHTQGWEMWDRISFDMWMVFGSRKMLKEYVILLNKGDKYSEFNELLINTLEEALVQWALVGRIMVREVRAGSNCLTPKIGERIRKLTELENKLNEQLKNFS
jgi:hypothetical protein